MAASSLSLSYAGTEDCGAFREGERSVGGYSQMRTSVRVDDSGRKVRK